MKKTEKILIVSVLAFVTVFVSLIVSVKKHTGTGFGGGGGGSSINNSAFQSLTVSNGGSGVGTIATTSIQLGATGTTTSAFCLNLQTATGGGVRAFIGGTTTPSSALGVDWVIEWGNCR